MSKWRPSSNDCVYVIPDIHGASNLLNKILKRILPLRKSDGIQDKIIFLGDYMDRHHDSHKVIDTLIDLENKYTENVIFLMGNHELLFLEALGIIPGHSYSFEMWMRNGGYQTLIGYIERAGLTEDPLSLNVGRIKNLIPKEHIDFLLTCLSLSHKIGNYLFVHGGCNPDKEITNSDINFVTWDRSLKNFVLQCIQNNEELPWEQVIVTGHNANGRGTPIIKDKFLMLDCGSPKRLLVTEINSMQAFMALPDKHRLIKFDLEETGKVPGAFRRI